MSEYWKSTPKYWCKHCSTYVRDTKLERANHEATGKHQSALKRFLRDLHRGHENEEREKDRAKREIDRLNGIVTNPSSSSSRISSTTNTTTASATPAQRQQQWEQLADMGISVPTELRRDMALAGEWTVTTTRVIDDHPKLDENDADSKSAASNVRKRPKQEDDDEDGGAEEAAVQGLFKKPRKWGRDAKHALGDDAELDALLSTPLTRPPEKESDGVEQLAIKEDPLPHIKKEDSETDAPALDVIEHTGNENPPGSAIKEEPSQELADPVVVFKKRKPKNVRQK